MKQTHLWGREEAVGNTVNISAQHILKPLDTAVDVLLLGKEIIEKVRKVY